MNKQLCVCVCVCTDAILPVTITFSGRTMSARRMTSVHEWRRGVIAMTSRNCGGRDRRGHGRGYSHIRCRIGSTNITYSRLRGYHRQWRTASSLRHQNTSLELIAYLLYYWYII